MLERLFRRRLRRWLEERALRLPQSEREKIAKTLGVEVELIEAIEEAIRTIIIKQLGL